MASPNRRPFRINSFNSYLRSAKISSSNFATTSSSVGFGFVGSSNSTLLLTDDDPLITDAISEFKSPDDTSLGAPSGMPKEKLTFVPSNITPTDAGLNGGNIVSFDSLVIAKRYIGPAGK